MSAAPPADAIAFVVATHDMAAQVEATLDSLLAACGPQDQIVVVDDGSRDDTADRVAAHAATRRGLLTLQRQANQGVVATRLAGLALATRPWVWFFDGDDQLRPEALAPLRAVLRDPAPDVVLFDFDFWWAGTERQPERLERSPRRTHPPRQRLHEPAQWLAQAYDDAIPALWSRVARRSLYDTVLPAHCPRWSRYEDMAVSPHLLAAARTLLYLPEPLVRYRQRAGSLSALQSLAACENLVRSALCACEAPATLAAAGIEVQAARAAAWRMLARKAIEAIRRAAEAGATADEILERLARPVLQAIGPDTAATVRQLQASPQRGDRRIAAHLRQLQAWPWGYARWRVLLGRYHRARRG